MTAFPNAHEERARSAKAFALTDAVDRHVRAAGLDPYADAAEVAAMLQGWPDAAWRQLAIGCGQRPPSDVTKALVIARVASRSKYADVDPFERCGGVS